jgi:Holliday junction resolvase RusA-like endonuclease
MRWMRAEPTVRRKGKHTFATAVKNAQQLIWEEIIQQIFTDYVTQNTLVLEDAGVDVLPWDGPIGIHTIGRYLRPKSATDWRDPLIPPDIDNVWKLVSDALEKVAYRNDQQIVQGGMKKIEVSDKPGTLIAITFYAKATKPTFNFRF